MIWFAHGNALWKMPGLGATNGEHMDAERKAIILGASSGIGKEMALWFARNGWRVGIVGRRKELLDDIASQSNGRILASAFDVNEVSLLPRRLDELAERLQGLDLLVISAGCGYLNETMAVEPEQKTIDTNVTAFTASAIWGYQRFKDMNRGQLAAITSIAGLLGEGAAPAYPASKAYQILYLDSLAKRMRKEKLGCALTELRPGFVNTDMMKGEGHFWVCEPAAAADLACRAIIRKRRLQYIAKRWSLIGFLLRLGALFK